MTRLLVVGAVWPEPNSSAAGAHILQVLRPFLSAGWQVTYASTALPSDHSADLSALGIASASVQVNDSRFDDLLRDLQPDVVLFDRFFIEEQFGWRVEAICADALRVLNCEDLHFLREAREAALECNRASTMPDLKSETARREVAAILRSDLSLIISEVEMDLLTCDFQLDVGLLHYCPFMLEATTEAERSETPDFASRRDFFTIGNFRHAPNWDSVQWLESEVWPLIRQRLPKARLRIAGAYARDGQLSLNAPDEGFLVQARIANADVGFREARVCLAPLRFGAGLKGKLFDAMRNGTPSVTTPIGAEGISGSLPFGGRIEANVESIADAAISLHENESEWRQAQRNGFEILDKRFDRDAHEPALFARIESARDDLTANRDNNFTGSMLRDHHHRSTRYLSLWIEAKNKLAARER